MGACLGKIKSNKVLPSTSEDEIRRRQTKSSGKHQRQDPVKSDDMMKQLEEAHIEEPKITTGGVSFTVDLKEGDPSRMPSRLADRLDGAISLEDSTNKVTYTSEEKELLAELMREDILRERSEKARRGREEDTIQ